MRDRGLHELIAALADREQIDWDAATRRVSNTALVQAAHVLARIAASATPSLAADRTPHGGVVRLLAILSIVQVAAGGIGLAAAIAIDPNWMMIARLATVLAFSAASGWLLSSRTDSRAAWLGIFYCLTAASFAQPGLAFLGRFEGDGGLSHLLTRGLVVEAFLPAALWRFGRSFPATHRFATADHVAAWGTRLATLVGTILMAANLLPYRGLSSSLSGFAQTFDRADSTRSRFWPTVLVFTFAALVVMVLRTRLAPKDERRRVNIFLLALVGGAVPLITEVLLEAFVEPFGRMLQEPWILRLVGAVVYIPLLAIPFGTAWAVVTLRVLEVRVVVREGLKYLLARRLLQILSAVPFLALAGYFGVNRNETLATLLRGPTSITLLALGSACLMVLSARSWLEQRINRWFRRTSDDASAVLASFGERLRYARTLGEIGDVMSAAVEAALHADATLFLTQDSRQSYYPSRGPAPALSRTAGLAVMLAAQRGPCVVGKYEPTSVYMLLPDADRRWIHASDASVIVPVMESADSGGLRGVLVCGARRDAVRVGKDDTRFLNALAAAVGMALDSVHWRQRGEDTADPDELADECVGCGSIQPPGRRSRCDCGASLRRSAVPARIHGKYQLDALIGQGGMGVVYRALDLHLGRHVAVKTLPRLDVLERTRLFSEARAMGTLSHPHLATLYGVEIWRATPLLIVEYLECGTLADRLSRGTLALRDVLDLGIAVAGALEYMHGKGVLHRDLKPGNIGYGTGAIVKVLDFGLAAVVSPLAGARVKDPAGGTLPYMSPEALNGGTVDSACDLWALCVLLYVAASGKYPFGGLRDFRWHLTEARYRDGLDSNAGALLPFFAVGFNAVPEERWVTAAALRLALENIRLDT